MKKYEITYLISDDVTDSEITKVTGKVSGLIADAKGKVEKEESWGRRKLAYPIDKKEFATYVTIEFEIDPLAVNNVTRDMRMMKEVVRLIAVLVDEKKAKVTLTTDDVAATKEIEDVVGSDKAFEALEGQTEDSYGLMSKRGEDDTDKDTRNKKQETNKSEDTITKVEDVKIKKDTEKPKKTVKKVEKEDPSTKLPPKADRQDDAKDASEEKIEKIAKKPAVKKAPAKKKPAKKKEDAKDEADRLNKLDKELDDLLGDDL